MSLFKKMSIAFLVFIGLLIALLVGLFATKPGIHLLFNSAVRWVPGLEIGKVEGSWQDLKFTNLQFVMPGIDVKIGQLGLEFEPGCLIKSQVCINSVRVRTVNVVVDTLRLAKQDPRSKSITETQPLTDLVTPYPIKLQQLLLNDVHLNLDGSTIELAHFETAARWQERLIILQPTEIAQLYIKLKKIAEPAGKQDPPPSTKPTLGEAIESIFEQPLIGSLPQIKLPVDLVVERILAEDLRLITKDEKVINRLFIQGSIQGTKVQLNTVKVNMPEGMLSITGNMELTERWPVSFLANGALNIAPYKGEKIKLSLKGKALDELMLDLNLSGPIAATLSAKTSLSVAGLPLNLTIESKKIQWPLTGKNEHLAQNIRLRLTGKATNYNLSMKAGLSSTTIPSAQLDIDAKGNTQQFILTRMRLATLEGKAELSGVADWNTAISWNSLLVIDGINTERQWPKWPAKLAGEITTRGSIHGGSWQLEVPMININGNLKQDLIKMTGAIKGNAAGQWQAKDLLFSLGKNYLEVKGELANRWALNAKINAPSLDQLSPNLAGTIQGKLQLLGSAKKPIVLADLTASRVRFNNVHVRNAAAKVELASEEQISGAVSIQVNQLMQDDMIIKQFSLIAKGNEKSHQLDLNLDGLPVSGKMHLAGNFNRSSERWQGLLNKTHFDTPVGEWRLRQDLVIDYRHKEQRASISAHCWKNLNAELCVPKVIDLGSSGSASLLLKRFDLAMLKPLVNETQFKGSFTGELNANWTKNDQLPKITAALVGKGVEITSPIAGVPIPVAFSTLALNANFDQQNALFDWRVKIVNNGQFNGNVKISDPQVQRGLSGNISIDKISLDLLQPILVKNERAAGVLNANLRLSGNVKAPQILGEIAIGGLSLDGRWVPVTINNSDLMLDFKGMSSTLLGKIKTEKGELNLAGDADWHNVEAWRAKITAKGESIRIDMPPMVKIDISPDLVFEATPTMLNLNGRVKVPWAMITVKDIPENAVGVSSNEVMLDNQLNPIVKKNSSMQINTQLEVDIGKEVALDAFGLKANLQGLLKVQQNYRGLGIHGQISIPSGRFHAYGQDLLIRKGELIFAGPADRPQLNIEAIRNPDATENSVTAGLRVTGFADRPKLEIFSDPALSQEEALSYLLRGQGLSTSSEDGNMMTSMLVSLGVAQSGKLVGKIGETFGVQNLALDTEGVGDSSQVVVSGYVLPGLQVKYGVGIFDSLATLTLRYRLMPRLYLEAVSGIDQALDLLYQFEF